MTARDIRIDAALRLWRRYYRSIRETSNGISFNDFYRERFDRVMYSLAQAAPSVAEDVHRALKDEVERIGYLTND